MYNCTFGMSIYKFIEIFSEPYKCYLVFNVSFTHTVLSPPTPPLVDAKAGIYYRNSLNK
jgi:hypothetical protein